jgi:hypothetical protein
VHLTYIDQRNSQTKVYYKRSPDGGTSWGPETSLSINYQDCVNPYIVASGQSVHFVYQYYSQTSLREIYYGGSTDGGLNWVSYQSLTVSPADAYYPFLAISGQSVHVVWYDKRDRNEEIYYKRNPTGNPIGITNIGSEIPSEFTLRQNYPNPFNPATNINFSITKADFVKLVVYDITGREISMLVNEQLTAGSYNVDFDASQLPSGTYFYRLTAGEFTETKKMILIK